MVLEPTFIEIIHHIDSTFWASSKNLIGNIGIEYIHISLELG